jgi:hypothetical protein
VEQCMGLWGWLSCHGSPVEVALIDGGTAVVLLSLLWCRVALLVVRQSSLLRSLTRLWCIQRLVYVVCAGTRESVVRMYFHLCGRKVDGVDFLCCPDAACPRRFPRAWLTTVYQHVQQLECTAGLRECGRVAQTVPQHPLVH